MLKRAKERTSHVSSVHVLWMCSTEFDADQHQGISFVRDDSFVMLAKPAVQTGERYSAEKKIEIYLFALSRQLRFIYIEIY